MKESEIRDAVISALREVAGPNCQAPITDQTKPIGNLGLESCDGLDFACTLRSSITKSPMTLIRSLTMTGKEPALSVRSSP